MKESNKVLRKLDSIELLLIEQNEVQKSILNIKEAVKYLNMTANCIYNLTSKKEIPFYKPHGKNLYFKRTELEEWILDSKHLSSNDIQDKANEFFTTANKK